MVYFPNTSSEKFVNNNYDIYMSTDGMQEEIHFMCDTYYYNTIYVYKEAAKWYIIITSYNTLNTIILYG